MSTTEKSESDILVKKYILGIEPCNKCIVKTCCTEKCEEVGIVNEDKSYDVTDKIKISFVEGNIVKDEIIDG